MSGHITLTNRGRMILVTSTTMPAELHTFLINKGKYNFPVCGDILRRILETDVDIEIDPDLNWELRLILNHQDTCQYTKNLKDAPGNEDLLDYQRVAVQWLCDIRKGILADAQGLGKTVIAVATAEALRAPRTIIVCPNAKVNDWVDHAKHWSGNKALVYKLVGDEKHRLDILNDWRQNKGYLVMNFSILHLHLDSILRALKPADMLIVDEAHKLRNRKTRAYRAAKRVSNKIDHVILVTASPTVNVVEDIWALLSILDSKRFGSFWGFVYRFCEIDDTGFGLNVKGLKDGEKENLERILSNYLIRREGELDLSPIHYRQVSYNMNGMQKRLYKAMATDNRCVFHGEECITWDKLAQLTRMRQLALDPGLIFNDYVGPSKLGVLVGLVQEREGQVVVFANYAKLVNLAVRRLKEAGISVTSVSGGLVANQRNEALSSFRSGESQVIVLTHGVGGEGLDLVEADRAIFLEYAWHPAGNEHAAKRIHRYGQTSKNVEVTFIHTVDSIEDHILDIISEKRKVTINELIKRCK